jgi:hypothetical protein
VVLGTDDGVCFSLVDPRHLFEEASVGVRMHVHVPEQGEGPYAFERARDLRVGDLGVEPVKGGGRYGQIEGRFLPAPLFERSHVHFRPGVRFEVAAGDRGQVLPTST